VTGPIASITSIDSGSFTVVQEGTSVAYPRALMVLRARECLSARRRIRINFLPGNDIVYTVQRHESKFLNPLLTPSELAPPKTSRHRQSTAITHFLPTLHFSSASSTAISFQIHSSVCSSVHPPFTILVLNVL
jgi:hypothetical protein